MGEYYTIYKPYYPFSRKDGYVREHRYIMYLYTSILNNKITYIEGLDVHHRNFNRFDNKIQNLQLLTRLEHTILEKTKDMSDRFCNLCKSKKTRKISVGKKYHYNWYNDINGFLCSNCYTRIRYLRVQSNNI